MSDQHDPGRESSERPHRKSMREWIGDFFSGEPDNVPELLEMLQDAAKRQLIEVDALNMIFGALHVSDMHARDIMIPRSALVVVQEDQQPADFLPTVIESRHSRFPVTGDDLDDTRVFYMLKICCPWCCKKAASLQHERQHSTRCGSAREQTPNVLLEEFRTNRNHMALVVDEYGQTSGVVTIEDVLEQIVGEIEDEHDVDDDSFVKQIEACSFHVKATTEIEDFNEYFGLDFSDEEFDTIGGIVLQAFGHVPELGETVEIQALRFEVLNADSRRLRLLRVDTPEPIRRDTQS